MSQNPITRRAYVIRPRQELIDHLLAAAEPDLIGICEEPTVVMTEPLPFEGKLEGFRSLILKRCKEAFLNNLFDFEPFTDLSQRNVLLGEQSSLVETFDRWWTTEEVDTLEIPTSW